MSISTWLLGILKFLLPCKFRAMFQSCVFCKAEPLAEVTGEQYDPYVVAMRERDAGGSSRLAAVHS